jgi:hypothetical protein
MEQTGVFELTALPVEIVWRILTYIFCADDMEFVQYTFGTDRVMHRILCDEFYRDLAPHYLRIRPKEAIDWLTGFPQARCSLVKRVDVSEDELDWLKWRSVPLCFPYVETFVALSPSVDGPTEQYERQKTVATRLLPAFANAKTLVLDLALYTYRSYGETNKEEALTKTLVGMGRLESLTLDSNPKENPCYIPSWCIGIIERHVKEHPGVLRRAHITAVRFEDEDLARISRLGSEYPHCNITIYDLDPPLRP